MHETLAGHLLQNHPSPCALLDRDGALVDCNSAFSRAVTRKGGEAVCGSSLCELLHDAGNPVWSELTTLPAGRSLVFESAAGEPEAKPLRFKARIFAALQKQASDSQVFLELLDADVQQHEPASRSCEPMRLEQQFQLSQQYRLVFENAPLGMFTSSSAGHFLEVNQALADMLGYDSPADVLAGVKNIAQDIYVHPERRHEIVEIIRQNPGLARFENDYLRRDGSQFTAFLHVSVLGAFEDGTICLLGLVEDITQRKQAEESLRRSEEEFHSIFDSAPVGIYQSTLEGRYLRVNPQFATMFGYASPEELEEVVDIGETFYKYPNDRSRMLELLLEREAVTNFETPCLREDGSEFWTSRNVRLMRDHVGRPSHIKGFVTDISQQKELEQLREDVERITRHDIKTPVLSCILGVRMLKKEKNLQAFQLELLDEMERSGQRMLAMINLSLDIYKMERGVYKLDPEPLDLVQLIREEAGSVLEAQKHKRLWLRLLVDEREPSWQECFVISGEELLCRSMFMNLFANAAEASPSDHAITVCMRQVDGMAAVAIHNHGAVPENIRGRFFEKYITAGKRHGTGLGTYSARLIATTHKGNISFRSSEEQGTEVLVTLPLPQDIA